MELKQESCRIVVTRLMPMSLTHEHEGKEILAIPKGFVKFKKIYSMHGLWYGEDVYGCDDDEFQGWIPLPEYEPSK